MLGKIACAAVISAATALPVHAGTWNFSYTGFYDEEAATWRPDLVIAGSFEGTDADRNGVISLPELDSFTIANHPYSFLDCGQIFFCSVDAFSYSPRGNLSFSAYWAYVDEIYGWDEHWITGDRYTYRYGDYMGNESRRTLLWTDDTVFRIAPVPEPSSAVMAGVGTLLLGAFQLRRRKQA